MQLIDQSRWNELFEQAKAVSDFAYCPFSNFRVGAAVLSEDGRIFAGCNVENASFGLTICAERNAVFQAIASGATKIVAVAIFTPTQVAAAPCGACRQVLAQFGRQAIVRSFCESVDILERSVPDLLPDPFLFEGG